MCGIFGVLAKPGAPRVPGAVAVRAMRVVRHRGSGLGAGFARARLPDERATLRAFVDGEPRVPALKRALENAGFLFDDAGRLAHPRPGTLPVWTVRPLEVPERARRAIDRVNDSFREGNAARVFQGARGLTVWKDVGHPDDVAAAHALAGETGDAWIAHTREPTNSPGRLPVWSHPFAAGEVAIVHNGDVSSFGANVRYLRKRGYTSFTGTDSEVVAILLHHLLEERGLSPGDAARTLVDPTRGDAPADLAGAALDGPFAIAATWATPTESLLMVLVDRAKLRPVVLGEDERAWYAASEESQIRAVSPDARVWTPEPGAAFLASSARGLLDAGRAQPRASPPRGIPRGAHVGAHVGAPAAGERFLAAAAPRGTRFAFAGPTGNCLANALDGGEVVVHGNVADDVADAMLSGRVVVHGDARDVLAQAMQGGLVLVRGSAGNRVALEMREFEDTVPALVVGGGVDDYLGEYMAGGVAVALNLVEGPDGLTTEGAPARATGRFVGTGMVGGAIYVRGNVADEDVALPGVESKYARRPSIARRALSSGDFARVGSAIEAFCAAFHVAPHVRESILASRFTVVSGRGGAADEAEEG